MNLYPELDQLAQDCSTAMRQLSWIPDKYYYDLVTCLMDRGWLPRKELIAADRFMIDFVNQAESLRNLWTPERVLAELITLDLSECQMEKFTRSLWSNFHDREV